MVIHITNQYVGWKFLTSGGRRGQITNVDPSYWMGYSVTAVVFRSLGPEPESYTERGHFYASLDPSTRDKLDITFIFPKSFKFFIW